MSMTEQNLSKPQHSKFIPPQAGTPLMQGLFTAAVNEPVYVPQPAIQRPVSAPPPCHHCKCHEIRDSYQSQLRVPEPIKIVKAESSPVAAPVDIEARQQMSAMQQQFISMQEEIRMLQQQVSRLLEVGTEPKIAPKTTDTGTQYSLAEKVDAEANTTKLVDCTHHSDSSFFTEIQGDVNFLLQQTDRLNSRDVKIIESDMSSESIPQTPKPPPKKTTEKSCFVNNLTDKYLQRRSTETMRNLDVKKGAGKAQTNEVSTTCYNYMMKYDLIPHDSRGFPTK